MENENKFKISAIVRYNDDVHKCDFKYAQLQFCIRIAERYHSLLMRFA